MDLRSNYPQQRTYFPKINKDELKGVCIGGPTQDGDVERFTTTSCESSTSNPTREEEVCSMDTC